MQRPATPQIFVYLRRNRSLCWTNEIKRYTEKQVESTNPAVTSEPEGLLAKRVPMLSCLPIAGWSKHVLGIFKTSGCEFIGG